MMDFQKKIIDFIQKNKMIDQGNEVILGLSGGADSVALFFVLTEYNRLLIEKCGEGFGLHCVYVHHMIREDADRDVELVMELCRKAGVPLSVEKRDVMAEARAASQTVEEAGRRIRYGIFDKYARDAALRGKVSRIAVAHHMDDQAETVLFNLARGTGITGLTGMRPVTGNIIRPLLSVTKAEILEYIKKRGQEYVTDVTNTDNAYSRNRLRNVTIPSLSQINERTVEHIAAAADRLSAIEAFLTRSVAHEYESCVEECDYRGIREYHLMTERFAKTDEALKDMLVRSILIKCAGRAKDISETHISSVMGLVSCDTGKQVVLPYGMTAYKTGCAVVVRRDRQSDNWQADGRQVNDGKPDTGHDLDTGGKWSFDIEVWDITEAPGISVAEDGSITVEKKQCTKFFDYDKINGCVHMRKVEASDEMVIDSQGHRKRVNRIFIDMKIPAYRREDCFVICDDEDILWIPGVRDAYICRVDENTKRVAVISVDMRD
ncbi:MAG: tRNA lysidine(34) synthetase TilS [Lachnospiraceae bacterium]|nr:tRNA lysidine(34) synthetase TilS [Lachnospiraceae bacterium]